MAGREDNSMLGHEKVAAEKFVQAKKFVSCLFQRLYYYQNKIMSYRSTPLRDRNMFTYEVRPGYQFIQNFKLTSTGLRLAQLAEELRLGASSFMSIPSQFSVVSAFFLTYKNILYGQFIILCGKWVLSKKALLACSTFVKINATTPIPLSVHRTTSSAPTTPQLLN